MGGDPSSAGRPNGLEALRDLDPVELDDNWPTP
jgi:hypothetical protein